MWAATSESEKHEGGKPLPIVDSKPLMRTWSLREMGRPCRGPYVLPVSFKYLSSSLARSMARSTNIWVKQLT